MNEQQQRREAIQFASHLSLAGVLLVIGAISFANVLTWQDPDDGVEWMATRGAVVATWVQPGGTADTAGIRVGDQLVTLDSRLLQPPTPELVDEFLWGRPIGQQIEYGLQRGGQSVIALVVIDGVRVENRHYYYLALVGLAFLAVGVFALLHKRAAASRRFFRLAATFYTLLVLSPTRSADPWFNEIFWFDQIARDAFPGVLLYFALNFPRPHRLLLEHRRELLVASFGAGAALLAANVVLFLGVPLIRLSTAMRASLLQTVSTVELLYMVSAIGLSSALFIGAYRTADSPLERKRLKWLVGGTVIGFTPFALILVPLQVAQVEHGPLMDLAILPMILIPVAYVRAAVGFRLWDVEVILKRAFAYTLASIIVLATYIGSNWGLSQLFPAGSFLPTASLLAMLLAAILFAPLCSWIQELSDRIYYRERYRQRRTLRAFGSELNRVVDLRQVVDLLAQRVRATLGVARVAVLLREQDDDCLRLVPARGDEPIGPVLSGSFSQFLASALSTRDFLYVDDLSELLEEFPEDNEKLADEDFAYFLPLEVKDDVVGMLALGRTLSGDYLSSEDITVLQPLAAHAALAIENALLYRDAHRRAYELERLKTYNENIVESIKVGVMVLDGEGTIVSWNRSLEKLHGVASAEAVGKKEAEVFPSSFVEVLDQVKARVGSSAELLVSAYRVALRTRDSRDRLVTLSVAPLLGEEGASGTVIIIDDVTERNELESQLRQAEKLASVGLLAAGVAHEVNTPLAGISSYVQMLQRKLPESDPRGSILEKIEKQTFRASQIVNNLLHFSRLETGDLRLVDLNDVVTETLSLADVQLGKRSIVVSTELHEQLAPVLGDPIRLQQVLMNLVLNARDAMPEGGDLRIATHRKNNEVFVEVSDTGRGIQRDHLDKIYDPFFTTKGVGRGTGLGLSVSYGIVQEHRGAITVKSVPGKGSRFRVTLPIQEGAAARVAS